MRNLAVDNAASVFVDQPLAEGLGSRTALVTPAGRCSYGELAALADHAAQSLRGLGVEPEQRVALLMPDGVGFAATFFGALKLGAVAVPLNTRLPGKDLRFILDDCRAKVVVTDRGLGAVAINDVLPAECGLLCGKFAHELPRMIAADASRMRSALYCRGKRALTLS